MKKLLSGWFLFLATFSYCAAANTTYTDLPQAVTSRMIQASATANGGLGKGNLKFRIRNTTGKKLSLRIPPGLHFKAPDPGTQDLLTVREELLALAPNAEQTVLLTGYCMNSRNKSPEAEAVFAFNGYAAAPLRLLSDSLARYQPLEEKYAQMFVWAITNRSSLYPIAVEEKLVQPATHIMKYVATASNQPAANVYAGSGGGYVMPSVNVFSKKAILLFHNPKDQVVSFKIYNEQGEVYHTLLENKKIRHGLTEYTFGINDIVAQGAEPVYHAKVTTASGEVLAQMKVDKNTEAVKTKPSARDFTFTFELTKGVKSAKLNVYLEDGTLVEEFKKYEYLPVGNYNIKVTLVHLYPPDTKFVVKMVGEKEAVVAQQQVANR